MKRIQKIKNSLCGNTLYTGFKIIISHEDTSWPRKLS